MEQPGRDDRRLNHVVPSSTVLLYNYVDGQRGLCSALLCVVGRKYEIWRLIKKIKQESRQNGFEIHLAKYTWMETVYTLYHTSSSFGATAPQWVRASSFTKFLDHTQRRITVGRTPLDEWSARGRDLYLTTHNTHNRQTFMPLVVFEPTISAGERLQTYALDRAATGNGLCHTLQLIYIVYIKKPLDSPGQAARVPGCEAPSFQDNRHMRVVRLSALHTGRLYPPGNIPGTLFC